MENLEEKLRKTAELIKNSSRIVAFTGAGVSVESGIPPFRGENGLWSKYDPGFLDIHYFLQHPKESWQLIKEIFYDFFGKAVPNEAHFALAALEQSGYLQSIITQNIDNLHQEAGSKKVYEFHGNSRNLICQQCSRYYPIKKIDLNTLPPRCPNCNAVLKPDFVFFGEAIPEPANTNSHDEALKADVFILIGTTGEIMPASLIPYEAKRNNKKIVEINVTPSRYTHTITDIFLDGKATVVMQALVDAVIGKKQ
ncbi:MAG: NAD-dependent deacylase [Deltaproteobacteria bacterium]|nr:NAD-dependent deacylase [Deltaproteobacteria bacterium]